MRSQQEKRILHTKKKAELSEIRRSSHFDYFDSEKDESTSEKLTRQMKQLSFNLPEKKSLLSIQEEDNLDQFMRLLSDQEAYSFPEHQYVEEMEVVLEEKVVVVEEKKTEVIVEAPQVEIPVLATQEKPQFFPQLKGMLVEEKDEITSKIGTFYHFIEQSLDLSLIDEIKSAMLEHFQEKYRMKVKVILPQQDLNAGIIHLHIMHAS